MAILDLGLIKDLPHLATCSTAAAIAAKTVVFPDFSLVEGAEITVTFTVTNTAANPTLNVNGTGAKPVYYRNAAISAGYLAANRTYRFVYNGTQYRLIGDIDTNTTYSVATQSANGLMSSTDKTKLDDIDWDDTQAAISTITGDITSLESDVAGKQDNIAAKTRTGGEVLLAPDTAGGAPGTKDLELFTRKDESPMVCPNGGAHASFFDWVNSADGRSFGYFMVSSSWGWPDSPAGGAMNWSVLMLRSAGGSANCLAFPSSSAPSSNPVANADQGIFWGRVNQTEVVWSRNPLADSLVLDSKSAVRGLSATWNGTAYTTLAALIAARLAATPVNMGKSGSFISGRYSINHADFTDLPVTPSISANRWILEISVFNDSIGNVLLWPMQSSGTAIYTGYFNGTEITWRQVIIGTDTTRAPLASPALTGTPTAPTAGLRTNSTQIATTAYADRAASPVGAVYIQFPGQAAPNDIYGTTWDNISATYAGCFFRAEGGAAAAFGTAQGDAIRNITGYVGYLPEAGGSVNDAFYSDGALHARVNTDAYSNTNMYGAILDASLQVPTAVENRPINYAVRIWKRIA
jgi:hypothetical protein